VEIDQVNKFNVFCNIELEYTLLTTTINHLFFIYSSFIAFPQYTITTRDAVIKRQEIFYWSAGVSYWFNTREKNNEHVLIIICFWMLKKSCGGIEVTENKKNGLPKNV
jgi:uncharacterized membrane protein